MVEKSASSSPNSGNSIGADGLFRVDGRQQFPSPAILSPFNSRLLVNSPGWMGSPLVGLGVFSPMLTLVWELLAPIRG